MSVMTIPMVPDNSEERRGAVQERTEDYELYTYPSNVTPFYRPIPILVQLVMLSCSCGLSFLFQESKKLSSLKFKQLLSIALSWLACRFIVQDLFYSPSSISQPWSNLKPCSLSKSTTITVSPTLPSAVKEEDQKNTVVKEPLGIHYIQYDNTDLTNDGRIMFDALHCNHGFGASSLSWLPALPSLTKAAKAPFGIAHDCIGFGLSERPKSLPYYTSVGTASIGNKLLQQQLLQQEKPLSSVVLLGHSMGCVATLTMALHFLPRETKKIVVLVAPALLPGKPSKNKNNLQKSTPKSRVAKVFQSIVNSQPSQVLNFIVKTFVSILRTVIFDIPLTIFVKRLVHARNFWKRGLSLAWGDPSILKDTDILRFEWPSVCKNWANGILSFTRSKLFYQDNNKDMELLEQVLNLPNTKVAIIHGSRDNVIPLSSSEGLVQKFNNNNNNNPIDFTILQGRGHDPFEENTQEFMEEFQKIVNKF